MADGAPHQIPLDEMVVRRLLELELRQVKEDVARLEKAATAGPPWWTSYLFAVLFAMISGWIGMIHVGRVRIARKSCGWPRCNTSICISASAWRT